MTASAHELPMPHDAEHGTFDENFDELEPDYEAEETNVKGGDYEPAHAATPEVDASSDTAEEKNEEND